MPRKCIGGGAVTNEAKRIKLTAENISAIERVLNENHSSKEAWVKSENGRVVVLKVERRLVSA